MIFTFLLVVRKLQFLLHFMILSAKLHIQVHVSSQESEFSVNWSDWRSMCPFQLLQLHLFTLN